MATNTSVTVGSSSTQVLPANWWREQVFLQNDSNEDIYISFWESAVLNKWMLLSKDWKSGVNLEQLEDKTLLRQQINAICVSGSKNLLVIYS
jgi:hypothetical protein